LEVRRAYRMDGIATGIKTGLLAQPQCLRVAPDGVWRQLAPGREWERTSTDPGSIGPITIGGAPYTAEEFRDAYVAMLGALADESLVIVDEGPPAYWRQAPWLSEGPLSGRLFGESRHVAA